jgi:type I restriction enzyme, S subunit
MNIELFIHTVQLEARNTPANEHIKRLTPSLLAKTFRGELVEQDPNDEPASVLLERIRGQREKSPLKESPQKNQTAKQMRMEI